MNTTIQNLSIEMSAFLKNKNIKWLTFKDSVKHTMAKMTLQGHCPNDNTEENEQLLVDEVTKLLSH